MRKFLRLDEEYNEELERAWNTPAPEVVPIGVPGVQKPSEISGHQTAWHGPKDKVRLRSSLLMTSLGNTAFMEPWMLTHIPPFGYYQSFINLVDTHSGT